MVLKKLALRLAGIGKNKDKNPKGKGKGKVKGTDSDQISTIVHHAHPDRNQDETDVQAITQLDMETSADDQDICLFFSRLPLEIRRLIYREVWKGYLESSCRQVPMPMRISSASMATQSLAPSLFSTDLGLHIYTDGSGGTKLGHTLCRVHDFAPDQGEQNRMSIQPWMYEEGSRPPMWLWRAWVMRQHWNRHWKCQSAVMKRWNPATGSVQEAEWSPFLPLFLTCKKMYWEAITSFFENVTLIFTSSKDAHRFFVLNPHPFASSIRTLELNFTDQNDHLFLQEIRHPGADGDEDENTAIVSNDSGGGPAMDQELVSNGPGSCSTLAGNDEHQCSSPTCYLDLFGQQLLDQILDGIQEQVPTLKDLVLTITGRMEHSPILDRFNYLPENEDVTDSGAVEGQVKEIVEKTVEEMVEYLNENKSESKGKAQALSQEKWDLPGNLTIGFEAEGTRYLVHRGGHLVRRRIE